MFLDDPYSVLFCFGFLQETHGRILNFDKIKAMVFSSKSITFVMLWTLNLKFDLCLVNLKKH